LNIDRPPLIRIQLPRSRDWIELTGQIAWLSQSKKEAGIRFDDLTTEVETHIRNWISSEISAAESPAESGRFARRKSPLPANSKVPTSAPHASEPGVSLVAPADDSVKLSIAPSAHGQQPETKDLSPRATLPPPSVIPDERGNAELRPGTPERRLHARRRVKSLAYIELSESNGGIVLNMSEDGLHVQAAVALTGDCFPLMRFQSPHAGNRVEAGGRIVWLSKSKREAGIQFVGLSEDERARIREWVSSQPSPIEIRDAKEVTLEKTERPSETPVVHELDGRFGGAETFAPAVQKTAQPSIPDPISASSSRSAGDRVTVTAPFIQRPILVGREQQISLELRKIGPLSRLAQYRNTGMMIGLIAIVVVSSFFLGRLAARQSTRVESPITAEIKTEPSDLSIKSADVPPASKIQRLPSDAVAGAPPSSHREATAPANSSARIPSPAAAATHPVERAAEPPRQNSSSNVSNKSSEAMRLSDHSTKIPPPTPAAHTSSVQPSDKPSQSPGKVSAQPKATIPEPARAAPISSQPVQAVIVKKEESAPAPVKPQESPSVPLGSVSVTFPPFPSIRVPPELKSQTARLGTSLLFGQLISRIDPVYPEDARKQLVEGTVKLHAIIGRDGAVQSVGLISGPALLVPSAMNAVQQWRFKQSLLGGQPIETEEDITVVFRLTNSPARAN
jgi:TonB family protein